MLLTDDDDVYRYTSGPCHSAVPFWERKKKNHEHSTEGKIGYNENKTVPKQNICNSYLTKCCCDVSFLQIYSLLQLEGPDI